MKRFTLFLISFTITLCATILFAGQANAETTDNSCKVSTVKESTPEVFKKSDVTRKLKDGTVQRFDGDKYKIVPRTQKRKVCKECVPSVKIVNTIEEKKVIVRKRNHLQLYLGNGPSDDLNTNRQGNTFSASSEDENLIGIGYSRDIIDLDEDLSLSIGGFYFSNETIGASVGLSW